MQDTLETNQDSRYLKELKQKVQEEKGVVSLMLIQLRFQFWASFSGEAQLVMKLSRSS